MRQFEFNGKKYFYQEPYLSSRSVEVPIIRRAMVDFQPHEVLEVGNIIYQYKKGLKHVVVDLYSTEYNYPLQADILNFWPVTKFRLVVAVSTLAKLDHKTKFAPLAAFYNLTMNCLAPGGKLLVTIPCRVNSMLDNLIANNYFPFTTLWGMQRVDTKNWLQCTPNVALNSKRTTKINSILVGEYTRAC